MTKSNLAIEAAAAPKSAADGRRRRSDDSRRRIVEAMLELVREGEAMPSADLVAERAGVGRRTVFRLFSDMESLYREMHAQMLRRIERIRAMPIAGETWRDRLDCIIERRVQLYEEILPIKTAADTQRPGSAFLQEAHAETVRTLRQMLLFVLPKQLKEDADIFEALDAALSIDVWRRLRQDQKLSAKAARRVFEKIVLSIVA